MGVWAGLDTDAVWDRCRNTDTVIPPEFQPEGYTLSVPIFIFCAGFVTRRAPVYCFCVSCVYVRLGGCTQPGRSLTPFFLKECWFRVRVGVTKLVEPVLVL